MNTFGNRIKKERENLNLSREQLANKLGVSYSAIAMYEQGNREPNNALSIKMCKEFGCSMDYLMGLTSHKNPKEELERDLYKLDLTEYEFDNLIKTFNEKREFEITVQYLLDLPDISKKRETSIIRTVLEYTADYIPEFSNNMTEEQKEDLNKTIEANILKAKTVVNSLDKSKIIHNFKKADLNMFPIPVLGKIAAGQPILAEEYLEGYLPVDPNIYGMTVPDDYFYLKVSGESMNLKVHNGDYALIKKQDYAENGDIIVAIVNGDDEATLKKYKKLNEQFVLLEPMSTDPTIETITIDLKNTKFQIIGKAIGQFGKF